jgi:TPP-dependent pyruvate/acetoin dehydrogenase alpha subunit
VSYILDNIYSKARKCRAFEESVFKYVKSGHIKVPVYLSAGQELISATISEFCRHIGIQPMIFAQHRSHSTYISFGGNVSCLIDELLSKETGCSKGMGGSASIHCPEIKMYGHDGLMGSNVPIGVGACFVSKSPTIIFVGDAAAEEDYALASYGWAVTKNLPILFVVEDNDLSILTEKKVRRTWEINEVTDSMGMLSFNIDDDPETILLSFNNNNWNFNAPMLLNINTVRKFWHSGAGIDGDPYDKLKGHDLSIERDHMEKLWKSRLETL